MSNTEPGEGDSRVQSSCEQDGLGEDEECLRRSGEKRNEGEHLSHVLVAFEERWKIERG